MLVTHQDVQIYVANLDAGDALTYSTDSTNLMWLQVVDGSLTINGHELTSGDGVGMTEAGVF